MSSADTVTTASATARATRSIIKGAGAQLAGKKRGADRRVRRGSIDVADPKARVWRAIHTGTKAGGLRFRDTLLKVAREYDQVGKATGRWGPIGTHTREVLYALLDLVDFRTGRLEPSYDKLVAMTGFARSTIGRALRRLRAHGFLDWVRRSRLVDKPDGEVAREQTSNAFVFDLARLPRCVLQRFRDLLARRDRAAEGEAAAATPAPPAALTIADPELAATLARVAALLDEGAE